ncbi:MAG TPA: NAD-glutamate dehydrogenase domain-containing protein [Egibacteraceae bacterium]|nr:NAD-glutamate dehydrogenase domain-containing protein [Egibacteraceae bacterium]
MDLLFAGGIGTYVRARGERDEDIGDRANDGVRVQADELRARVICEGANLSVTQAARIQYARRGGRVNQDAIDNAAGVAISDREVNAKILLRGVAGCDSAEVARLLAASEADVVAGVLADVGLQSACLTAEQRGGAARAASYERLMAELEAAGRLDREEELLPSTAEMASRAERGVALLRPELATLLAYAKRRLVAAIVDSPLPDQPVLAEELRRYFPPALVERAGPALDAHPLRRDLIATRLANDLVNRLGVTFAFDLAADMGVSPSVVAAAYWVARDVAGATRWWSMLLAREDDLGLDRVLELQERLDSLVAALVRGLVADPAGTRPLLEDTGSVLARDAGGFAALLAADVGTSRRRRERRDTAGRLTTELGDAALAAVLAGVEELAYAPEILRVARTSRRAPAEVAEAFFLLGDHLGTPRLVRLARRAEAAPGEWADRQRRGLEEDIAVAWLAAVADALGGAPEEAVRDALRRFADSREAAVESARDVLSQVEHEQEPTLDMVAVAVRALTRAVASPAPEDGS